VTAAEPPQGGMAIMIPRTMVYVPTVGNTVNMWMMERMRKIQGQGELNF